VLYPPLAVFYGLPSPDDRVMELAERAIDGWRPRFLVLTPNFHGEDYFRRWFDAWQRRHPGRAVLRYRDPDDPRFEVFELRPPGDS
jgi:hypothetical protein